MRSVNSIISECLKNKKKYLKDLLLLTAKIKDIPYEKLVFSSDSIFLNDEETSLFLKMLERYEHNEPVSKIINNRHFWKHNFFVNSDVLDPRPETELIIEMILERFNTNNSLRFLDLGTGSGCILLSLLSEFKNATGIGIDISEQAITVAKYNQKKLDLNISAEFLNINWKDFVSRQKFDVIVSNPPYIKTEDIQLLEENVKNYDPLVALDGGITGFEAYQEIVSRAKNWLQPNGTILFEIGYEQANFVKKILQDNKFKIESIRRDLCKIERVITAVL